MVLLYQKRKSVIAKVIRKSTPFSDMSKLFTVSISAWLKNKVLLDSKPNISMGKCLSLTLSVKWNSSLF